MTELPRGQGFALPHLTGTRRYPVLGYPDTGSKTRCVSKSLHSANYALMRRLLAELRSTAGRSQSDIAEALGRPQSFVSKYETGERRLDFVEVMELLAVLGADPHGFVENYLTAAAVGAATDGLGVSGRSPARKVHGRRR